MFLSSFALFCGVAVKRFFSQFRWTLHCHGFYRCDSVDDPHCVLYWANSPPPPHIRRRLQHPQCRILHFPHITELTHKQRLSLNVERQRRRWKERREREVEENNDGGTGDGGEVTEEEIPNGVLFPSIPTSFVLPQQLTEWMAEHQRRGGVAHWEIQRAVAQHSAQPRQWKEEEAADEDCVSGGDEGSDVGDELCAAFYGGHVAPLCLPSPSSPRCSPPLWILKPSHQGSGRGIVVSDLRFPSPSLLRALSGSYVVQRYIERPLLLEGCKMDLRLYVAVLSSSFPSTVTPSPVTARLFPQFPFQVFLFDDGLVRVASQPYPAHEEATDVNPSPPLYSSASLQCPFIHLTNNAINRQVSPLCGQSQNRSFQQWLSSPAVPHAGELLRRIELCCLSTLSSSPQLLRAASSPLSSSHGHFALLGFDLVVGEGDFLPHLCEVNHLPDLLVAASPYSAIYPVDAAVKTALIADLLTLIQLPPTRQRKEEEVKRQSVKTVEDGRGGGETEKESGSGRTLPHHVGGFHRLV